MTTTATPALVLVDVGPVAEVLAVTARTVQRLAETGEIPGVRVGKQWRFDPEAVAAALAEGPMAVTLAEAFRQASTHPERTIRS